MSPLEQAKRVTARLPWITRLTEPVACDAVKLSRLPLMDRYDLQTGYKTAADIPNTSKCTRRGYWRTTPLKHDGGLAGTYCWGHLWDFGLCNTRELNRITRYLKRHPEIEQEESAR